MKKGKNEKNQKIQQAVYKFRFSKEQQRDLKTSFDIFDKDGTGKLIYLQIFKNFIIQTIHF